MLMKAIEAAGSDDLTWSTDDQPALIRRRSDRGFCYRDPEGRVIRERTALDRIRSPAIPPAWEEVWICPDQRGHIQATGRDARGRKQYSYHPDWTTRAATEKFGRLPDFARRLPRMSRLNGTFRCAALARTRSWHSGASAGDHPDQGGKRGLRAPEPQLRLAACYQNPDHSRWS